MVISVKWSSEWAMSRCPNPPSAMPMTTPPTNERKKETIAEPGSKPPYAAARSAPNRMSAVASLKRLSPSRMICNGRLEPRLRKLDSTATGSVAATIAPKRRAMTHGISSPQWTTVPVTRVARNTPPTASAATATRKSQSDRGLMTNAASNSSGGKKSNSTTSELSTGAGMGDAPSASPKKSRASVNGSFTQPAMTATTAATISRRTTSSTPPTDVFTLPCAWVGRVEHARDRQFVVRSANCGENGLAPLREAARSDGVAGSSVFPEWLGVVAAGDSWVGVGAEPAGLYGFYRATQQGGDDA